MSTHIKTYDAGEVESPFRVEIHKDGKVYLVRKILPDEHLLIQQVHYTLGEAEMFAHSLFGDMCRREIIEDPGVAPLVVPTEEHTDRPTRIPSQANIPNPMNSQANFSVGVDEMPTGFSCRLIRPDGTIFMERVFPSRHEAEDHRDQLLQAWAGGLTKKPTRIMSWWRTLSHWVTLDR